MITAGKVLNYVGRERGGGTREISFFPSEIVQGYVYIAITCDFCTARYPNNNSATNDHQI